jgi:hypothetical protein
LVPPFGLSALPVSMALAACLAALLALMLMRQGRLSATTSGVSA